MSSTCRNIPVLRNSSTHTGWVQSTSPQTFEREEMFITPCILSCCHIHTLRITQGEFRNVQNCKLQKGFQFRSPYLVTARHCNLNLFNCFCCHFFSLRALKPQYLQSITTIGTSSTFKYQYGCGVLISLVLRHHLEIQHRKDVKLILTDPTTSKLLEQMRESIYYSTPFLFNAFFVMVKLVTLFSIDMDSIFAEQTIPIFGLTAAKSL